MPSVSRGYPEAMLAPGDRAFLDEALRSGRLRPEQARWLAERCADAPGGIAQAAVRAGLLDAKSAHSLAEASRSRSNASRGEAATERSVSARARRRSARLAHAPRVPGYAIEDVLGRGGMGAVYLAVHKASGRRVALKLLLRPGERQLARFEREAEALRRLRHPSVVDFVDAGRAGENAYLALEYLRGGDLQAALDAGRLGRPQLLRIFAQVARALAAAHRLGILHRDVKPANVLLDEEGQPKVTDFGLAKILDRETQLTRTNASLGTPYSMAPEQVRGGEYRATVDTYGLGVALYQALTGHYPFDAEEKAELFRKILEVPPTPPHRLADVPRPLSELVLWMLEKDPADRPSCRLVAEHLEAYLGGTPRRVRSPSARRRRRRLAAALAGSSLAIVLALLAVRGEERTLEASRARALEGLLHAANEARGGDALAPLLREARAHEAVEDFLATVPAAQRADALRRAAPTRARHGEVLRKAVHLLLAQGRRSEAESFARRLCAVVGKPAAELLLARVLAESATGREEAFALARRHLEALPPDPALRWRLAEVFWTLARPRLAARALPLPVEDAAPARRELAARILRACGRIPEALAATRPAAAATDSSAPIGLACLRAELELDTGAPPADVLASLEAIGAGAARPAWHFARARAFAAAGRPGRARRAFDEASRLAPRPAHLARARWLLGRGRRLSALRELERASPDGFARRPAARLDAAVARWLGGAPAGDTTQALSEVAAAADAYCAPPSLAAAADRWRARVELARGDASAALAAARSAWEREASPQSACALAWVLWRSDEHASARAALAAAAERTLDGRLLAARLVLARGDLAAARAATQTLPPEFPGRAALLRELARRGGEGDAALAARTEALWRAWLLTDPGRAPPTPQASREGEAPLTRTVRRLLYEARRLYPAARSRRGDARAVALRLLERALRLEPDCLPARVLAADLGEDAQALDALVEAYPTLLEARRARLFFWRRLQARGERVSPEASRKDLAALRDTGGLERLEPVERVAAALALRRGGDSDGAWALLRPVLDGLPRRIDALRLAAQLVRSRGDEAAAARYERAAAEVLATSREQQELYRHAYVGEGGEGLDEALAALARIERDLPHGSLYWTLRAQAQLGQARFADALVSGAEFLRAAQRGLTADGLSLWIHAYGWTPQFRDRLLEDRTAERRATRPWDSVPWAARALFRAARYNLSNAHDPDDLEAAVDFILHAGELDPLATGYAALAANLFVSLGEEAEAQERVAAALTLDPTCDFARFQQARLAARRGDVRGALSVLRRVGRLERVKNLQQLERDVAFDPVREHPDFEEFLAALRAKSPR
ncbi:MAG: serine/threonine protein kinase [Planctomycetota bacterium]|nr:MAG: serine/threonine protein kinase [Planctomycetota bacterium]